VNLNIIDISALLLTVVACSLRTFVAFALLPIFTSSQVPAIVRAGIAVAIVVPVVVTRLDTPPLAVLDAWSLLMLVFREGAIGMVIGLGFGALVSGMQMAGDIIDHQTGLTFTQNVDPSFGNSVSITALFLERVLFAALMAAGLMLVIVDALYLSYEIWPVGKPLPSFDRLVPLSLINHSGRVFSLALLLAGPVVLVLFVVDTSLGMMNRAAPQLGVFNLALSIKPLVGLAVLAFALPMIVDHSLLAMGEFGKLVRALVYAKS
jgi:type III secretion protein T